MGCGGPRLPRCTRDNSGCSSRSGVDSTSKSAGLCAWKVAHVYLLYKGSCSFSVVIFQHAVFCMWARYDEYLASSSSHVSHTRYSSGVSSGSLISRCSSIPCGPPTLPLCQGSARGSGSSAAAVAAVMRGSLHPRLVQLEPATQRDSLLALDSTHLPEGSHDPAWWLTRPTERSHIKEGSTATHASADSATGNKDTTDTDSQDKKECEKPKRLVPHAGFVW